MITINPYKPTSVVGLNGKRLYFRDVFSMVTPDGVDYRPKTSFMPMEDCMCWNYMTVAQQELLSKDGVIDRRVEGLGYGGGPCQNKATVKVRIGNSYGPRFYCQSCAGVTYL